ncbi:acetolactate synthase, large subunit [Syntrophus gentianae]|uniref:Acetolactate synthase n=1 Tax=Syntrophus gentianae TaxID=43775 RepID=A0A1H7UYZ7_9BACT|nr:biosynthetic-type acetolactate synthase large subunit [Syntrophus gentianae]SEM02181.1 acetolactate synthase, large subunit [Syntrophus gentianae]
MKLTGSQILFKALYAEGVDTIFGYPGGSVIDLYDEMFRQEGIKHYLVRHEQGAVHAADGYARATGKTGVCLVTSGPGATNTVTGIANAYADSIPVVILTGQVATHMIGKDAFQEVDITGITRPCTKHNFLVRRVEDLGRNIREAFHIARSGRPGPVLVDIPKDILQATLEEEAISMVINLPAEPPTENIDAACAEALSLIKASRKPVIFIGGGVLRGKAVGELRTFVDAVHAPVTGSLMGLGAFPGTDPRWLGMLGMHGTYYANMAVSHSDLLIAVGVRFDDRVTSKVAEFAPNAKIIHIDIDPVSINKIVKAHVSIISDCREALQRINTMTEGQVLLSEDQTRDWLDQIEKWKRDVPLGYCRSEKIKPQYVIEKLYELTRGEAIITTEVGQNQMWAAQFYHFDHPDTFISSGGLGTMGFGLPAAIGAQVAFPDRTVVDVAGDGSIQMNIQELATAVYYDLPVKVVILNNGFLGMVRQWQDMFYGKRYSQTHMKQALDFVKLAEAFGAVGLRATKPEEVEDVLRKGLETPGAVMMDFHVEPEEQVYPMVSPGAALTDMKLGNLRRDAD